MAKAAVAFVLLLAIVLGGLYVLLYQPQQQALEEAEREASLRAQEGSTLRSRVADLEDMLEKFRQTSAELEAEVKQKEEELEGMRATQDELLGELEQEIADGQIQIERLRGQLRVDMVDEILFDSGEAVIKAEGADVLRRVGGVLKKAEDRHVVVQGHTDNVPIIGRLAERFPTNWELSAARAVNVVRFLQDDVGMDPARLGAAGFSEYRPRADNETEEGRQKNRRIELLLAPLPDIREEDEPKP
jgi:chemotaxis protein MotB